MSADDNATAALALGVDVEELYILLAEGVQVANNGLPAGTFEQAERKVQRSRDALLRGGIDADVVERFEAAVATLRPSQPGPPPEEFIRQTITAGELLGDLMTEIREGLPESPGKAFDVGVMAARVHLCLRVTQGDAQAEMQLIYLKELQRAVPILLSMLQAVAADSNLRFVEASVREDLQRLELTLERYDVSPEWRQRALRRSDELFSDVGMTISAPLPERLPDETSPDDDEDGLLSALLGYRETLVQIAEDGDAVTAETGQRLLIEDCRKALGPDHPLTLAVRGDLALSVLYQERGDLAVDLALDLSDDAEAWRGPRDQATAGAQYVALLILMSTREFDDVRPYYEDKLRWLTDEDPANLDEDMASLRDNLRELVIG